MVDTVVVVVPGEAAPPSWQVVVVGNDALSAVRSFDTEAEEAEPDIFFYRAAPMYVAFRARSRTTAATKRRAVQPSPEEEEEEDDDVVVVK